MSQLTAPVVHGIGGALCLEFCNTVSWRGLPREVDRLADLTGFAAWCRGSGLPPPDQASWQHALGLRAAIFRTFLACAQGRSPAAADLAPIWSTYGAALAHGALVPEGTGARIALSPDDPLAPIVRSAVELICAPPQRLKLCDTPHCGWLFLDTTKNGGRRFCDMRLCGNRTRAREHYARQKAARA